ncbi:50S ribosomal protein L11p (L12e) [Candidatus Nasuia deltocephalinicola]|nr:50S ribosomal protein L11p (L12e) [Candidatus Nasuia deltocephalinicola]
MKKKIGLIKLKIISGKATPSPPIGPSLGQKGINIIDFCKKFNEYTKNIENILLSVKIFFYFDKSYDFFFIKSSISFLIKKLLKIDKISLLKGKIYINYKDVIDITNYKILDFNTSNFYSAFKTVSASINSMGINIIK